MRKTVIFIILSLVLWNSPGLSKVYIDIDSPAFQRFPIAIPDFKDMGDGADRDKLAGKLAEELTKTLAITGYFRIITPKAFIEDARTAGITADTIDFSDWTGIGSEFLIKGGIHYGEKNVSVEFRLFDVVEGKLITGKKYWGTSEETNVMVRKFAGEILLALTGERGVFDTKIAFTGKRGKISDLFVINFDGSGFQQLTHHKTITLLPHWSADGKKLAYTSYKRGNPDFYIMDLSNGKIRRVTSYKGLNLSGPWSPDGHRILLTLSKDGNEEIYVLDYEAKKLKRLTRNAAIDVSPTWSPDGSKIAFVSNRSGSPQIFIMNSDGSDVRRLTYEGKYNTSPSWSPTGKRIAYEGTSNGHFQIFSIDEDGGNHLQLTFERGGCEDPSWSPDGRYITFSAGGNGKIRVCVINSNGLNLRVLHEQANMESIYPAWSPRLNLY